MTTGLDATELDEYVSLERGEIGRRIFSDEEIFEQEMKLIFGRAWLFLCHETQIPRAGDFFETPMGRDNVLTVRQRDGSIKAFVNTCTHRGNAVCRAEEGNTKAFMCTYHGWSFALNGDLIGVPDSDLFYKGDLDRSKYGLRKVAHLANYHGFVFATMDESAPPLEDYLGLTGRICIDFLACRDVEVVPGVQKFVIDCNWKLAVDNLFDWYHGQITHMSAFGIGFLPSSEDSQVDGGGAQNTLGEKIELKGGLPDGRDELALIGEFGHAHSGPSARSVAGHPMSGSDAWKERPDAIERLGPVGLQIAGHSNIFPTCWLTNSQLSLRVPISPTRTEIWWFSFVEKDLPPDARKFKIGMMNHVFGPSGFLEQEDGENWAQATMQTRGGRSRQVPHLLKMNLGRGKVIHEHGVARIESTTNEHAQLWTYHAWAQWMKGLGWDDLRGATVPPEVM
jgi:3-phenylpropionate/trans-cinnamate dioxygenase alpha subunit